MAAGAKSLLQALHVKMSSRRKFLIPAALVLIGVSLWNILPDYLDNPYVWGGTSLTDGADCSSFVQSIYREYGYELPRVAAEQAYAGT